MEKDLTTGNVFKNVIQFSLPYLLSYFCRRFTEWQTFLLSVNSRALPA